MPAPEGKCWLCNKHGKLTKEHIPPESAFNDRQVLLMKVDEQNSRSKGLRWAPHRLQGGVYFRSLCEECNSRYGSKYGGAYVDLVAKVADRIKDTQDYHRMSLSGIKRPLAILKQILLQFVTANGPSFVRANNWVSPFIREPNNRTIPEDIGIYVYASNRPGLRMTGVGAHINASSGRGDIAAEFTFWPLGTVLSFGHLGNNDRLTPIHHWTQYSFEYRGDTDLTLSVNPMVTSTPLDYRNETLVLADMQRTHAPGTKPSEETARSIFDKAIRHSGSQDNEFSVVAHPALRNK